MITKLKYNKFNQILIRVSVVIIMLASYSLYKQSIFTNHNYSVKEMSDVNHPVDEMTDDGRWFYIHTDGYISGVIFDDQNSIYLFNTLKKLNDSFNSFNNKLNKSTFKVKGISRFKINIGAITSNHIIWYVYCFCKIMS